MSEPVQTPLTKSAAFPTRIFSGIQPSGGLTLGNYLGALKRFVEKQDEGIETVYCLVDMHAITVWQDPVKLRHQTREAAAGFIAAGIDPTRSILFNQSQVTAHAELAWIFNCIARMGWMGRMTQWKDKTAGKDAEAASLGLFAYPALMAADILAYKATHVPVGEDQKQHLELCRDIAIKFNHDYKVNFFPVVEPVIEGAATRVMSLRDGTAKRVIKPGQIFSRIHVEDIANTLDASIAHPHPGRAYNVCDDEACPPQDVVEYGARLLGLPVPPDVPFEEATLSPMAKSFYADSKRVSNERIVKELGLRLSYPTYREGLAAIAKELGQ